MRPGTTSRCLQPCAVGTSAGIDAACVSSVYAVEVHGRGRLPLRVADVLGVDSSCVLDGHLGSRKLRCVVFEERLQQLLVNRPDTLRLLSDTEAREDLPQQVI
jgi:hypothetical protein